MTARKKGVRHGGRPIKYVLTDEIREYIVRFYDGCNRRQIAERFNVPPWRVSRWAVELGVARTKEPPWSQTDLFYLEENLSRLTWKGLARNLGRTVCAVKLKAKRLGLAKLSYADGLTQRELARVLGVDDHAVGIWSERGWIHRRARGTERKRIQGGDVWLYTNAAILRFVVDHPECINLRRVDREWFLALISGPILGSLAPGLGEWAA